MLLDSGSAGTATVASALVLGSDTLASVLAAVDTTLAADTVAGLVVAGTLVVVVAAGTLVELVVVDTYHLDLGVAYLKQVQHIPMVVADKLVEQLMVPIIQPCFCRRLGFAFFSKIFF